VRLLGAIIAGGQSRRFGGDKGAALLGGKALIEHVADALRPQVDALVMCGRPWPGLQSIDDRPAPDLGPLGGLCAALHHAADHGFDAVLSAGCDVLPVPDLRQVTGSAAAAVVAGQPLLGYWPVALAQRLDDHLASQPDRSMRGWVAASGACELATEGAFHNLNTRAELALYCAAEGLVA
jgi:molybdenum cofactor guanylyltransferase